MNVSACSLLAVVSPAPCFVLVPVSELSDKKRAVEVRFCLPGTGPWGKQEEEKCNG